MEHTTAQVGENEVQLSVDGESEFDEMFDITVGQTLVTDEDSGRQTVLWKAISEDGDETVERLSDSPTDAVMGVIDEQTGGII